MNCQNQIEPNGEYFEYTEGGKTHLMISAKKLLPYLVGYFHPSELSELEDDASNAEPHEDGCKVAHLFVSRQELAKRAGKDAPPPPGAVMLTYCADCEDWMVFIESPSALLVKGKQP